MPFRLLALATQLLLLASSAFSFAPQRLNHNWQNSTQLVARQNVGKLVFCHFIIGITANRASSADYDNDMQRAKAASIDAFALNMTDSYTDQQLGFAYDSAARNGMKVFISFDFNWYHDTSDAAAVGNKIKQYASLPAQLIVNGNVYISSFVGDGLNIATVRSVAGLPLMIVPNWHPQYGTNMAPVDGAFNWMGWDNDGNNKAPKNGKLVTVADGDNIYNTALAGKPYLAPVSPWFSTHFGTEVSYSKNWVFPSDLLWYNRWRQILTMQPRWVEIITWNDYGESHYVGPLSSPHTDDGASKWVNDMPHGGWLEMMKPFIAAYKAGATSPDAYITQDQIVYWYRPTPKALNCDATDTTMTGTDNGSGNYFNGRPDGYTTMADQVFVVTLLKSAGVVTVNSGGTLYTYNAPAGASAFSVNFNVGSQAFALIRNGQTVMSATSLKQISNICPCGLYNFNAYVGVVPALAADSLSGAGYNMFSPGLKVACAPAPSLPATPPGTTAVSQTIQVNGATPTVTPTVTPTTTPTTTPSATPTAPAGWKAVGCIYDPSNNRVLPTQVSSSTAQTIDKCLASCSAAGFAYGGPEYGIECWCGAKLASTVVSTSCTMPCAGNSAQTCGGGNALMVYQSTATSTPTVTTTPTATSTYTATAAGCFYDPGDSRVLPTMISSKSSQSVDSCLASCNAAGFAYGGTEYGIECWCGSSVNSHGSSTSCNMACSGNAGQTCGGVNALSVYNLGTTSTTPTPTTTPTATNTYTATAVGCLYDPGDNRVLPTMISSKSTQTIDSCLSSCNGAGFAYGGVEYGVECWCGASVNSHGTSTSCTMPCSGNSGQTCGGGNAISVFNLAASTTPTATPTTTPVSSTLPAGWSYVGCKLDTGNPRLLTKQLSSTNSQTIPSCLNSCQTAGYSYGGGEYGIECWCDSSLPASAYGLDESQCNMVCPGDSTSSYKCGGVNALSVYRRA